MQENMTIRSKDPLATAEIVDSDDYVAFPEIPMSEAEQK